MPAITIVQSTPTAMMAAIAVCRIMLADVASVRKFGAASDSATHRMSEADHIGLDRQALEQGSHHRLAAEP